MKRHQFCSGSVSKAEETEQSLLILQGVIAIAQRLVWETHDPVNYKDDLSNIGRIKQRQLALVILCRHLKSVVCLYLCDWSGVDWANVPV